MVRVLNWTERFISACDKQPQQESGHPLEQQQQRAAQAHGRLLQSKPTKKEMSSEESKAFQCKPQKDAMVRVVLWTKRVSKKSIAFPKRRKTIPLDQHRRRGYRLTQ